MKTYWLLMAMTLSDSRPGGQSQTWSGGGRTSSSGPIARRTITLPWWTSRS